MPKLTKSVVDATLPDPGGKRLYIWDTVVVGFGLHVTPSGARSCVLQYRSGGRTRRITIGKHGSPWTVDLARAEARRLLEELAKGQDPLDAKRENADPLTVAELIDLYLRDGPAEKPNKKKSSWVTDRSNLERHVRSLLGLRPIAALTSQEIARFQQDVNAGRSARTEKTKARGKAVVRGGPGAASRALAVLGAMLEFAHRRKLIPSNPAKGVPLLKLPKRQRFLTEAEVARVGEALDLLAATSNTGRMMANAIRLLMLTGCRKSEIVGLRWSEIDWERKAIVLSRDRSKSGDVRIPLSGVAVDFLADLHRDASPFVFPAARGERHIVGIQKAWEAIRKTADLPGVRIHDLRHSFASFGVNAGLSLTLLAKLLGHSQVRTTEIYAHIGETPSHAAAEVTAQTVARALNRRKNP